MKSFYLAAVLIAGNELPLTWPQIKLVALISLAITLGGFMVIGTAIQANCKDWIEQVTGKRPEMKALLLAGTA